MNYLKPWLITLVNKPPVVKTMQFLDRHHFEFWLMGLLQSMTCFALGLIVIRLGFERGPGWTIIPTMIVLGFITWLFGSRLREVSDA